MSASENLWAWAVGYRKLLLAFARLRLASHCEGTNFSLAKLCEKAEPSSELRILRRLATDVRMKRVWKEIYRQEEATNETGERRFFHAAEAEALEVGRSHTARLRRQALTFVFRGDEPEIEQARRRQATIKKEDTRLIEFLRPGQFFLQDYAASVFLDQAFHCASQGYEVVKLTGKLLQIVGDWQK